MFSKYFTELQKELLKKSPAAKKIVSKGGKGEKEPDNEYGALIESMNKVIPYYLKVDAVKIIDASGFSPKGVDFVAYKEIVRDISSIMDGFIPAEIIYGTFHVCQNLTNETLIKKIDDIIQAKKISRYTDETNNEVVVPAFIIAYKSDLNLGDLKKILSDYYFSKSIDFNNEFDIIVIMDVGIIVKDWRERRSYIALETGHDTFKWFFILMSEYLDIERNVSVDFRDYVERKEKYNEY